MITQVHRPRSAAEAVDALGDGGTVLAGGTHLMAGLNVHGSPDTELVSLRDAGMSGVDIAGDTAVVGATTTLSAIADHPRLPDLAAVVATIAAPPVRTLATVAGNCFVPQPYGDLLAALVALDAEIDTTGPAGQRTRPVQEAAAGGLGPAEIATRIRFRVPEPGTFRFHKATRRRQNSASIVTVAAHVSTAPDATVTDVRVAIGGMAPTVVRAEPAERELVGAPLDAERIAEAAAAVTPALAPPSDAYASSWYRSRVFPVHLRRALLGR